MISGERGVRMHRRLLLFLLIFSVLICIPPFLFPENVSIEDAQFQLARDLFQKEQYSEAIVEFNRLLQEIGSKKYADASHYYLGSSYIRMNNYEDAGKKFMLIIDNYRGSKYHSLSFYMLARLQFLQNNFDDAIKLFDSYMQNYPSLEYADNSLYWKAEALLRLGRRNDAKQVLRELLKRYPHGDKADSAMLKLKLLELEEAKRAQEEPVAEGPDFVEAPPQEPDVMSTEMEALKEELKKLKEREKNLLSEIDKLNKELDSLNTEIESLKEMESSSVAELELRIRERINALISWENVLKIKERALNQKEKELLLEYEKLKKIESMLE